MQHCKTIVLELTVTKTNEIIKKEMPRLVKLVVDKDREVSHVDVFGMVSKEFAAHAPKIIKNSSSPSNAKYNISSVSPFHTPSTATQTSNLIFNNFSIKPMKAKPTRSNPADLKYGSLKQVKPGYDREIMKGVFEDAVKPMTKRKQRFHAHATATLQKDLRADVDVQTRKVPSPEYAQRLPCTEFPEAQLMTSRTQARKMLGELLNAPHCYNYPLLSIIEPEVGHHVCGWNPVLALAGAGYLVNVMAIC
ncbi:hypothetical protein Tco_0918091 [Tanacetum coccineum]